MKLPCTATGLACSVSEGPVQAIWQIEPSPITVGRRFALWVTLCPADAVVLRVEATMPEHRHGMNTARASSRSAKADDVSKACCGAWPGARS